MAFPYHLTLREAQQQYDEQARQEDPAEYIEGEEFNSKLEDEYMFDAHYPPGVEIGTMLEPQAPLKLQHDYGSGSCAEDGRQEILEDRMSDELGSAAMYGPTEIGNYAEEGGSEIGNYAEDGGSEIGNGSGFIAQDGPSEIGAGVDSVESYMAYVNNDSVGNYAEDGASEVGTLYSEEGAAEIGKGTPIQMPFESFMLEEERFGQFAEDGAAEIGTLYSEEGAAEIGTLYSEEGAAEIGQYAEDGGSEIGAEEWYPGSYAEVGPTEIGAAVLKVVKKARDNRVPPPPMKAVHVDAPAPADDFLSDVVLGAAVASGVNPFPLTTELLARAGAGMPPRYVRVDTEESYQAWRAQTSPELAELHQRLEEHIADPHAHEVDDALSDDVDDLVNLGAAAEAAEEDKRVDMFMSPRYDGKTRAWREGDDVCGSLQLPLPDGSSRICTSVESIEKCVGEMSRHAAESGVSIGEIADVLPMLGCALGAGTVYKEMAAAAPALTQQAAARPPGVFFRRIEPKVNPAFSALAMLANACCQGNAQACDEWTRLFASSPPIVQQAMAEVLQLVKAAA